MSNLPPKSPITCHVLDSSLGKPAAGVRVRLESVSGSDKAVKYTHIASGATDADGRCMQLWPISAQDPSEFVSYELTSGSYKITFHVNEYFAKTDRQCFYSLVEINFIVENPSEHYHIPLLISPYSYTTYRGS